VPDSTSSRFNRIARAYDVLDLPFEYLRYRPLRRMLFAGLSGNILDAGVGTGRNMEFYPPEAEVTGIDVSPAMLARAEHRRARLGASATLLERDIRDTGLPDHSFDAIVASFLFCVLPQERHHAALASLRDCANRAAKCGCSTIPGPASRFAALSPGCGSPG
jgi:ubiquinone/menaquinone biosynthesis C-methylase UbiE